MRMAMGLCVVMLALIGCDKSQPAAPAMPQVARGKGSIVGQVRFKGKVPAAERKFCECDPSPGAPKIEHVDRTVAVSKDGGLADVYVYVKGGPNGPIRGSGQAEPAAILDQKNCDFEPHALAVQIGQPVRIRNSDPTFHNVHWASTKNREENLPFQGNSGEQIRAFAAPEFMSVKCDVHKWMSSSIGVFENPFFAVTDGEGKFKIAGLPAGTYTVGIWHEYYQDVDAAGKAIEQTVTVGEGGEATAEFTVSR